MDEEAKRRLSSLTSNWRVRTVTTNKAGLVSFYTVRDYDNNAETARGLDTMAEAGTNHPTQKGKV